MTNSETYIDANGDLVPVPVLDAQQMGTSPGYRIAPVADGWVAIVARDFGAAGSARAVAGVEHENRIADAIVARSVDDLLTALPRPASPGARARRPVRGVLRFRRESVAGLVAEYPHPVYGSFRQPGVFWSFGDLDVRLDRAPPALGQHTVEILEELDFTRAADQRARRRRRCERGLTTAATGESDSERRELARSERPRAGYPGSERATNQKGSKPIRAWTSGRRSGGTVFGGCRRSGRRRGAAR